MIQFNLVGIYQHWRASLQNEIIIRTQEVPAEIVNRNRYKQFKQPLVLWCFAHKWIQIYLSSCRVGSRKRFGLRQIDVNQSHKLNMVCLACFTDKSNREQLVKELRRWRKSRNAMLLGPYSGYGRCCNCWAQKELKRHHKDKEEEREEEEEGEEALVTRTITITIIPLPTAR